MHVNACKEAPLAANTTAATDQLSAEIHTLQMAQESIMQQLAGPAASVTQVGLEALPAGGQQAGGDGRAHSPGPSPSSSSYGKLPSHRTHAPSSRRSRTANWRYLRITSHAVSSCTAACTSAGSTQLCAAARSCLLPAQVQDAVHELTCRQSPCPSC